MTVNERLQTVKVALALLVCLLILGSWLRTSDLIARFDTLSYDFLLPLQAPMMSEDIIIIDIDEASILELGRWPWPRQTHAELLDVISPHQPKAVGLDILFTEAQSPLADSLFSEAIARNGSTFLIVAPTAINQRSIMSELLPLPSYAANAAGIGHVDVELDIDGINRKFYLYGGMGNAHWPSLALAMIKHGGDAFLSAKKMDSNPNAPAFSRGWVRDYGGLIPFSKAGDQALHISYSDALKQRTRPLQFKNKYVLVGVTAAGVGDRIATPSYRQHERMPGVELLAQQLNGLLQDIVLHEVPSIFQWILTLLIIGLGTICIMFAPLRHGFWVTVGLVVFTLAMTAISLVKLRYWFAPSASILTLMVSWPLWNLWRIRYNAKSQLELQQRLDSLLSNHPLTGLPNQGGLEQRIDHLINAKTSQYLGLVVCHFDSADSASSVFDRTQGKKTLESIASRLNKMNKDGYFCAHLNGDAFAFLIPAKIDNGDTRQFVQRLMASFSRPISVDNNSIILPPRVGVSTWPKDSQDTNGLMRNAATAAFKARFDGNSQECFYSETIGEEIHARYELEQALVHAIERVELELHFQPQINIASGKIKSAEALLRWKNPQLGWISPRSFIPVAEHVGMISAIGDWVLKKACVLLNELQNQGHGDFRLGLNISPQQFSSPNFSNRVQLIVEAFGIHPSRLEFEVTESTLMGDLDVAATVMEELTDFGIEFAVDDFGTGYSTLSHLQKLPYRRLKIDQSFTAELERNRSSNSIILSIIDMAKRLNLEVVAGGVEAKEQEQFLRENGCDELQGFLFSPAIPFDDLLVLLNEDKHYLD